MSEDWRKHLEFVEAVIARQAGNSFLVKGWALTVATAVYGYAASKDRWQVAAVGALAVLAFWYLDGFYLRQERLYRCLYRAVAATGFGTAPTPAPALYSMDANTYKTEDENRWPEVLRSKPVAVFFGSLLAVGIVVSAATGLSQPEAKEDLTDDKSESSSSAGVS